jgi:hypothetical protein
VSKFEDHAEIYERQCRAGNLGHPDDIEFYLAGTMLPLSEAGYELHYPSGRIAFRMQRRPQKCRPLISSTKVTSLNF